MCSVCVYVYGYRVLREWKCIVKRVECRLLCAGVVLIVKFRMCRCRVQWQVCICSVQCVVGSVQCGVFRSNMQHECVLSCVRCSVW